MRSRQKAMLIVLDGWGIRKSKKGNAIANAHTPCFDSLWKQNLRTQLFAAENFVGLPKGFIGNSEVGHTHLGAGRLIPMELMHLNNLIRSRRFFDNPKLLAAMRHVKRKQSTLHLLGLLSDGGVHSHINHLFALLKMAKEQNVKEVMIHCFLDGRDVPPKSAKAYINLLEKKCKGLKIGKIATIIGRFYAMDRDNRWNREHKAYDAMVNGKGRHYDTATKALSDAYKRKETDEFVSPSIISPTKSKKLVRSDDSIIFFNFRSDRAREITSAFVDGKFNSFKRKKRLNLKFVCLTQYDRKIKADVAFPPAITTETIGEVLSKKKIRQFRIAETEKYAHVTFFFNSGRQTPFPMEDRLLIPSPKVKTYDKKPEMSCKKVASECIKTINKNRHDLIVLNFANPDMVGHTGNYKAAVKAVEAVDICLGKVIKAAQENDYNIIITADHGNAEEMTGKHSTSHTLNKVPCIFLTNKSWKLVNDPHNSIANISPTLLTLMEIKPPKIHTQALLGHSLLER